MVGESFFKILFFSILFLGLAGCMEESSSRCETSTTSPCHEDSTKVNIRILNISEYNYCDVIFNPGGSRAIYGPIGKGDLTCYRSFDLAYDYAYVSLKIDGKDFTLQPVDYVGEEPLPNGYYTYKIGVSDFENRVLTDEIAREN